MSETKITTELLREAMRILDDDGPIETRTVYPKHFAKYMRERGTWDDSRMVEQKDLPILPGRSMWK
jgi:hypothetical protein